MSQSLAVPKDLSADRLTRLTGRLAGRLADGTWLAGWRLAGWQLEGWQLPGRLRWKAGNCQVGCETSSYLDQSRHTVGTVADKRSRAPWMCSERASESRTPLEGACPALSTMKRSRKWEKKDPAGHLQLALAGQLAPISIQNQPWNILSMFGPWNILSTGLSFMLCTCAYYSKCWLRQYVS